MRFYACYHRDDRILGESTSGGAFTALAEQVIAQGGLVVGASYAKNLSVEHTIVETRAGLSVLRGVKYVLGTISVDVWREMDVALSANRPVMFCGLPCQVAAARKRWGEKENLLLVDLVCFGAPPQYLWLKYVHWLEQKKGAHLVGVNPRDKTCGWGRRTYYSFHWEDGAVSRQRSSFSPYAGAFYSTLGFRRCCFECQFRGASHRSDITIGDCWGAETLSFSAARLSKGISLAVCHNVKGEKAVLECNCEVVEVAEDLVRKQNSPFFSSPKMRDEWGAFQVDSMRLPMEALAKKYGLCISRMAYLRGLIRDAICKKGDSV